MSTTARQRLLRDYKKMKSEQQFGFDAEPLDDNIQILDALIYGPEDTVWDGGIFRLKLYFSDEYPLQPPKVKFVTQIFHPNVYPDGSICLDILQNQWSVTFDVSAVLMSIRSLLCDPNPDSPANSEAAHMYVENKKLYNQKIREVVEQTWKVK